MIISNDLGNLNSGFIGECCVCKDVSNLYYFHPTDGFVNACFIFNYNSQTEQYFKMNYRIFVTRMKYTIAQFSKQINVSESNIYLMKDILEIK
jgi:hypothetical protein